MKQLPRRSKLYGVGKQMGHSVYLHKSAADALVGHIDLLALAIRNSTFPPSFEWDVVKYNSDQRAITLVKCECFDLQHEPVIIEQWYLPTWGKKRHRHREDDPMIYHHKWLMVRPDYDGFDVEESMERSRRWLAVGGYNSSRIVRLSYWRSVVLPKL